MKLRRLKHRPDFLRCARGIRRVAPGFTVETGPTPMQFRQRESVRVGFTASKKIGNAVARNRAKRRLRALATAVLPLYGEGDNDYVLVARAGTLTRDYTGMLEEFSALLKALCGRPAPAEEP